MRLPVRRHPSVAADLREALSWYRVIDPDLARRMRQETDRAMRHIAAYPPAASPIFGEYRRVILEHFPYMVIYRVLSDHVEVLAVFHLRRDPEPMRRQLDDRRSA